MVDAETSESETAVYLNDDDVVSSVTTVVTNKRQHCQHHFWLWVQLAHIGCHGNSLAYIIYMSHCGTRDTNTVTVTT